MQPTVHFEGRTIPGEVFFAGCQRAASALRAAGVGEGDVVAVLLTNGPAALEVMAAARSIGALWCPINWHFKTEEVQFILLDSAAKVLVADAALLGALHGLRTQGLAVFVARSSDERVAAAVSGAASWASWRDGTARASVAPCAPRGAMFYTSGTTGRPKGIRRAPATAQQAATALEVMRRVLGLEPGMRALLSAPMYHSAPNSYALGAANEQAELFIEARFDAERTLQLIEQHRITHAYLVPTMYVRLLRLPEAVRGRYDLSSMRFVASTGSPCPPRVKRAMIDWWGPVIHEAYGASELGYMTMLDSHDALCKPGSAGRPLPGVTLAILDEQGHAMPRGAAGLIYVNQPAFSDFDYVGNHAARERMERDGLKTLGDVGYLDDDGFLFIVDRSADLVISGGANIYPAEIEAVLHTLPGVVDCAVFGIPDEEFGESLAAAVQCSGTAALSVADVREHLRVHLADFKVPKVIEFHAELPREDTGKIFKRRLREPYWAGLTRRI